MPEANNGIIAELDRYFLRKNPSDFLGTKDETGEVISHQSQKDCGSLRPGLIAVEIICRVEFLEFLRLAGRAV